MYNFLTLGIISKQNTGCLFYFIYNLHVMYCLQRAFCAYCHDRIWGLGRQGFKCIQCKLLIHKKCHKLIQKPCTNESVEPIHRDDTNGEPSTTSKSNLFFSRVLHLWRFICHGHVMCFLFTVDHWFLFMYWTKCTYFTYIFNMNTYPVPFKIQLSLFPHLYYIN